MQVFFKLGILKCHNINMKTPKLESFLNKSDQACNFIKKRLQHRCFPVNIPKFIRTYLFQNICKRLLLSVGIGVDIFRLYVLVNFRPLCSVHV